LRLHITLRRRLMQRVNAERIAARGEQKYSADKIQMSSHSVLLFHCP
jgi:hypothetical protein